MTYASTLRAAGLALTCGFLTAGCATRGEATSAAAFPAGKYHNGDTIAIFNADGTFVGTTTQGEDWVKGTYTSSGDRFTMEDTWEGEKLTAQMGKSCMAVRGTYRWTLAGDVLTATAIDDPCEGRKEGTSGVAWTRMP